MTALQFNGLSLESGLLLGGLLLVAGWALCRLGLSRLQPRLRYTILGLRMATLLVLGVLLFNPGHWVEQRLFRNSEWMILLDRSASMLVEDVDGESRWNRALEWTKKLSESAGHPDDIRLRPFARNLEAPVSRNRLKDLAPDGDATDTSSALWDLLAPYQAGAGRLRGVVLISDGRNTQDPSPQASALALAMDTPVHTLCLGDDVLQPDVSLHMPPRPHVAFMGKPIPLRLTVRSTGLPPQRATLLLKQDGRTLQSLDIDLPAASTRPALLSYTPEHPGYQALTLEVAAHPDETRRDNNRIETGITVLAQPIRILFVEGRPFWDSKFLVQFLRNQPHTEVTALFRLSPQRSFALMPGAETPDPEGAFTFPEQLDDLCAFDVMVLGKNCDALLTSSQIGLLKQAVRTRGLGVILARGKPYDNDWPEFAPLEPGVWGPPLARSLPFIPLKHEVWDTLPDPEDDVWRQLPPLNHIHRLEELHPFAEVLAEGRAPDHQPVTLLAFRRYGRGVVMALNAEGFWRWDFFPKHDQSSRLYRELWSNLLLWTSTHTDFLPGRDFSFDLSASVTDPDRPVSLRVRTRMPGDVEVAPFVQAVSSDGGEARIALASGDADGQWRGVWIPRTPGVYRLALLDEEGRIPTGLSRTLHVQPPPTEQDRLSADPDALEELSRTTEGTPMTEANWKHVLRQLDRPEVEENRGRSVWEPAWDRAWVVVALIGLLGAEWFLRRRNGLL